MAGERNAVEAVVRARYEADRTGLRPIREETERAARIGERLRESARAPGQPGCYDRRASPHAVAILNTEQNPEARKRDDHALLTALEEFLVDHCGGEERFEHDPRS
jgi:hypothetical protein